MITQQSRTGKKKIIVELAAVSVLMGSAIVHADSLFPVKKAAKASTGSSNVNASSLYTDIRAHDVGDLLTIVVLESTTAQSAATTKTSQDDSVSAFAGTGLFARIFKELPLTANNSRNGNGSGTTTRSGTLTTTLSVLVKEVLPNGTMKVEGSRMVGINKETQHVIFSGVVRPEDISPDNTISSNLIAQVEVHYDGKGIVAETQRMGILSRAFKFLF